jgi:succinate dehydrogenase hydrophobic anchor subunit
MTVGNSLCASDSEGRIYSYLEGYIAGVKHELMQVDDVLQYLRGTVEEVLTINPNIHTIITLSPIAIHGTLGIDTTLADCLSKSNCRIAINRVLEIFNSNVLH